MQDQASPPAETVLWATPSLILIHSADKDNANAIAGDVGADRRLGRDASSIQAVVGVIYSTTQLRFILLSSCVDVMISTWYWYLVVAPRDNDHDNDMRRALKFPSSPCFSFYVFVSTWRWSTTPSCQKQYFYARRGLHSGTAPSRCARRAGLAYQKKIILLSKPALRALHLHIHIHVHTHVARRHQSSCSSLKLFFSITLATWRPPAVLCMCSSYRSYGR